MNGARSAVIAIGLILSAHAATAQDVSRYRAFALGSSLDSVIAASGGRLADVETLHQRPATIQELRWRAPYVTSREKPADPVREIVFRFFNRSLYQIVVNYDRDRTEGLTNNDILDTLSATYGMPSPVAAGSRMNPPADALRDSIVLARWETAESLLVLVRGSYNPEFQLFLTSKALQIQAGSAIRESVRLDGIDAPRRELEQRKKEAADASAERDRTRTDNKAAFRP